MWANHDWLNIQPATFDNSRVKLTEGEISKELWGTISTYIVENYFKQPNYWKIDGKPYFSIYEIITFINGLGGIDEAKKAIELLDEKTKKAGFPGVHFNIMSWMVNDVLVKQVKGNGPPKSAKEMMATLQCESVSTYAYIHHFNYSKSNFPTVPYSEALTQNKTDAKYFLDRYNPKHKILVLNSWNEWTEGSYLLPEKRYGDAYLKAIKKVFGN